MPQHNLSTTFFVPLCMCVRQLKDVEWKLVSTFRLGHVHLEPKQALLDFFLFWRLLLVPTVSARRDIPMSVSVYQSTLYLVTLGFARLKRIWSRHTVMMKSNQIWIEQKGSIKTLTSLPSIRQSKIGVQPSLAACNPV